MTHGVEKKFIEGRVCRSPGCGSKTYTILVETSLPDEVLYAGRESIVFGPGPYNQDQYDDLSDDDGDFPLKEENAPSLKNQYATQHSCVGCSAVFINPEKWSIPE